MMTTSAVVLLSGGVDSTTLLHFVARWLGVSAVHALSFRYGQKHARELEMARWQARAVGVAEHRVMDLSGMAELTRGGSALTDPALAVPDMAAIPESQRTQPPTYVPNRNMVFLALAAAYAESVGVADIYYGAQQQDEYGYWDCTETFVERLNNVLALNRKTPIRAHAPFVGMNKAAVVKIGLELGVDYNHTWTCYRGGENPCGRCPACVERERAFAIGGVRPGIDTKACEWRERK
jgi:7-cyano-7-deazaguanine synthase